MPCMELLRRFQQPYVGKKNYYRHWLHMRRRMHKESGAQFLGVHIEGPYIAMNQKGAHFLCFIRDPDEKEYEEILLGSHSNIKRWSAAPELKGALKLGRYLRSKGILPSIAHSDATYKEVYEAFESGYTHITHFYCVMSGYPCRLFPLCRCYSKADISLMKPTWEIIADGVHLPEPLLTLVL